MQSLLRLEGLEGPSVLALLDGLGCFGGNRCGCNSRLRDLRDGLGRYFDGGLGCNLDGLDLSGQSCDLGGRLRQQQQGRLSRSRWQPWLAGRQRNLRMG